ncbi:SMP-30/gluconolactonase/LRE family protein [Aldersonia sp. NBC_00410]|uniref:SMP-30/gluconolactonase/LRE family protein n=1 Tax=Aldersonia sp. NBC_00410 TaxID=2975954 RepID=UPI0022578946|nr:SMP-30/gluconolactonase/LRE family protein [Aldersonia sp. NBC_00410]MCX5043571.1 SMP-30/gluconolactonase/LRE family protein [Aldersonia sp. NBC_00410]
MSRTVETVLSGYSYLECPRWHDGRIWFADFYTHEVVSAAPDGTDVRLETTVDQQPSGLGWLPDGRLVVVSMRDHRLLRREADGALVTHADLAEHVGGYPNDMVIDRDGRAYVGNFGFDLFGGAPLETACLLRVDPDGAVHRVAEDLHFPNGSVITEAGVLIVDETLANRMTAFDIGPGGELTNRRTWASFGDVPSAPDLEQALGEIAVAPDGCCLDAEGAVWVADALGGRVLRVREGGSIAEEIAVGTGVFACMLGGEDGRTLFLCAAPDFIEENRMHTREAELRAVHVDVPRAGLP